MISHIKIPLRRNDIDLCCRRQYNKKIRENEVYFHLSKEMK